MMRGMKMPAALLLLLTLQTANSASILQLTPSRPSVVGCLFSEELCTPGAEWCYDDGAFGRCIIINGDANAEDLHRYEFEKEELEALESEIEKLMLEGYMWSHRRTQCILQTLLYSFRTGNEFNRLICDLMKPDEIENKQLMVFETPLQMDLEDPKDMAYIRYTPSADDPHAEFADEVYIPPDRQEPLLFQQLAQENPIEQESNYAEDPSLIEDGEYAVVRRSFPQSLPDLPPRARHFTSRYNTPTSFRSGYETREHVLPRVYEDNLDDGTFSPELRQIIDEEINNVVPQLENGANTEDLMEEGQILKQLQDDEERMLLLELASSILDNSEEKDNIADKGYTEGGLVFPRGRNKDFDDAYQGLLDEIGWGFKRRERLDVKKPGPQFNTNNYAFQETSTHQMPTHLHELLKKKIEGQKEVSDTTAKNTAAMPHPHKKMVDNLEGPDEQYDIVDTTFAYIEFKDSVRTWKEGSHIINTVAALLQVPRALFTQERVDRNEVTFKVEEPNALGLNASEVSKRIGDIKEELRQEIGVVVTSVGIGDKTKLPSMMRLGGGLGSGGESDMYVALVIVCGVLAALAMSAGLLFLARRHTANKLQGLTTVTDTEPSKHYQDLCRARMSSKTKSDTGGPGNNSNNTGTVSAAAQRIASLSRESDNSPSSRSSTSSWSEEPTLTNMDVSTGQMVLAYMEEHLNNKEKLETEWTALCAYEADPCATTIAQRPESEKKNRYPNALPYDHARVVLNELSNITGSDYINASTITDHDPRNPAYIVTQGPLPHSAPDLWQMVWEQGCVVIVMLTRLIENDSQMCHRYWPEEGSELYHIFEVHLVSEHIWCDDYLVRSFYLKNLKTGETRTVTQFHFLSWPEGGVPVSVKALLEFRRKVNKSFRGRSCPIVVHCSDGVGRSGTYCLLDMVLNRMAKGAKEIDIAATLEHIRDQRAHSVATKQQFQTVLAAVHEEVQAILRLLPQPQQPQQQ